MTMPERSIRTADVWMLLMLILLCLMLLFTPGCAHQPQLSAAGNLAVTDTQVIHAIDIVRDAAVSLNAQTPPVMATGSVRKVVDFHESAVKVIAATPNGWKPIVLAALTQLQADLPPPEWQRIAPYVTLVVTLINGGA